MSHFFLQYKKSIFISLVILILSTISGSSLQKVPIIELPNLDKIIHFIMYFALSTALLTDIYKENKRFSVKSIWFIILFPFLYGVLMELLQKYFVANRTCDILDVLANTIGLLTAIIFFRKSKSYQKWVLKLMRLF